jgi:NAD(P)-dependent dehydrogenase (short-subunit alcohol dehydrogenase family)
MQLEESVCIVTGAARGLGAAIATALAGQGAILALVDIQDVALYNTAAQLAAQGVRALPIVADITIPEQVEAMSAQVEAVLGPIEVLVNNAGTFSVIGPVWETDPELWFRDVKTNLYGNYLVCRSVVGRMVARQRGYVINIVSSGGVGDPHPYSTSYASSKAGLMRLTEGLAAEVAEYGIVVFAVAPPAILTDMTRFIVDDPGGRKWRPAFRSIFEQGRDHPPELVADLVVELLSGRADQLTGRYILATGNLETLIAQADQIVEEDLWTLRIRKQGNTER